MARLNLKDATPRERFLTSAALRVSRAIDAIESLGRCSDPNRYEYSVDDIEEMFSALQMEISKAQKRFANAEQIDGKNRKFTFSAE